MEKLEVVAAVLFDEACGVLCALRGQDMQLAGMWEFPGGKVEENENHHTALRREVMEELNCEIEVNDHIVSVIHDYETVCIHLHTYWCKLVAAEPTASEHEEIRWVLPQDLKQLSWAPADLPTIEVLVKFPNINSPNP